MCVIIAVTQESQDLTSAEFRRASICHDDGYGIAYMHKGQVKYYKTMSPTERDVNFRPPKPYIMHFRMSTVGGNEVRLCHPFTVDKNSRPKKHGLAKKVMFHNGHITNWEELALAAYSSVGRLPKGPYSDSRAVAMMLGRFGDNIFDIEGIIGGQRYATLDLEGDMKLFGHGWLCSKDDNIYRSNQQHLNSAYSYLGMNDDGDIEWTPGQKETYPTFNKGIGECFDCGCSLKFANNTDLCQACFTQRLDNGCYKCGKAIMSTLDKGFKFGLCADCFEDEVMYTSCSECGIDLGNLHSKCLGLCYKCRTPRPCIECGEDLKLKERKNSICALCEEAQWVNKARFGGKVAADAIPKTHKMIKGSDNANIKT